jgi:hypothetical protein
MTEIQKSTVIDLEAASQRLSDTREDQPMSRALGPVRSRSDKEQWQTALRGQSVRKVLPVESDSTLPTQSTDEQWTRSRWEVTALNTDIQRLPAEAGAQQIQATRALSIPPGRQLSRYYPLSTEVLLPDKLALDRQVSLLLTGKNLPLSFQPQDSPALKDPKPLETDGGREAREQKMSRAETIVLNAIRSKADIDGNRAKVDYDGLADMTGFSRRHVMRVVKSLIFERQRLRVDKRVIKPGHNAINVYHVVTPLHQEVTAAEGGASLSTGKIGTKREKPDRLNNKGDRICHPHSQTTNNIPLSPTRATDKTGSKYLTAGRKLL